MPVTWNPWHGCRKISAGCQNCYVYRTDEKHGKDASQVYKTAAFNLPMRKTRSGAYKLPPGDTVYTCFTSDLLLEEADEWREDIWAMMRHRSDLEFFFITKRIHRLGECLPSDWDDGYHNVQICSTVENQELVDRRLPILLEAPIRKKGIICEPLLGPIDLTPYLTPEIRMVITGGESGSNARVCRFEWILELRQQCDQHNIPFRFKQTGARFVKDGKLYEIPRKYQHTQAQKAGIDTYHE